MSMKYNLKQYKPEKVGFFEKIPLKIAGKKDGKRGIPKEDKNGNWTSPLIERELRAYDEFESKTYRNLQIEQRENYSELGKILDTLQNLEKDIEIINKDISEAEAVENMIDIKRMPGERSLTDVQVRMRRLNESAKRIRPLKDQLKSLLSLHRSKKVEFSEIYQNIYEEINNARMVCEKNKKHIYQRIIVYWDAAYKKHPEKEDMPVLPEMDIKSDAETVYKKLHEYVTRRTQELDVCSNEEREAA